MSKSDSLIIPFNFLADPVLRRLATEAGEEVPAMLGRLLALAVAITLNNRVKYLQSEIDAITGWRGKEPLAYGLESVGWAKCEGKTGVMVRLTLPSVLQKLNVRAIAGQARARIAERGPDGRYLTPETPRKARYEKRTKVRLNAEGMPID